MDGSSQIVPWSIWCSGLGQDKNKRNVGTILGITSAFLQVSLHCSQGAPGCEDNTESHCRWKGNDLILQMILAAIVAVPTVCSYWSTVNWRSTYSRTTGAKSRHFKWFCFNCEVSSDDVQLIISNVTTLHLTRGVLETLIRRHFPMPTSGIDMTLFVDDPTLPGNSRKRKRGRALFLVDDNDSSGK